MSRGAPTPAGTSVFSKHNWGMERGYLWLDGWGIYHLMGGAFMAYCVVMDGAFMAYWVVMDGAFMAYRVVTDGAFMAYWVVTDGAFMAYWVVMDGTFIVLQSKRANSVVFKICCYIQESV